MIISEQEKNRIRGLHREFSVIQEQDQVKGKEAVSRIEGISTNLLTPAVQEHLKGKKASTIEMLQIIAGCWVHSKKSGPRWAGLGPGGQSWEQKGGPMPMIRPGEKDGTVSSQVKTGWGETINPCKMYKVPEGWRRSDFLVPAIVNFWTKRATSLSNTPTDQYDDDGDELYSQKKLNKMQSIGNRLTWVPDGSKGINTMWTLTKK